MATLVSTILANARIDIKETTASFWSDAELLQHFKEGVNDLWGAIIDLNEEHFQTVDVTNVSQAANSSTLTGVPTDVFRILLIEPLDTTPTASGGGTIYYPRPYNSDEARNARSLTAQDPSGGVCVYYSVAAAGSPVAAPTVYVQPQLSSALALRFVYVPGPGSAALTSGSTNPIGGESDKALRAWVAAFARSKEREDRSPDPAFLAIYKVEKQSLLVRMAPRQSQEPEVVGGFFDAWY